jgi:hypothetical protein
MKPQDLLLGVRDFFAILIPGAALLLVLQALAPLPDSLPAWLTKALARIDGFSGLPGAFIFAVAAFVAGQVVSSLSTLLDWPVDRFERNCGPLLKRYPRLRRLDPGLRLWRFRCLATVLKDRATSRLIDSGDGAAPASGPGRQDRLRGDDRLWSVKSFWRDYLRLNQPEAIAELDRIESHQKMFRSFGIVALILAGLLVPHLEAVYLVVAPLAFLVCYYQFVRFRLEFFYRLYKLAVLTTLPDDFLKKVVDPFFAGVPSLLKEIGAGSGTAGPSEPPTTAQNEG